MAGLVDQGMREGAVGLSTGLEYVPCRFSSAAEITALCRTVARHGGVYVTHMRGGYEAGAPEGIAEVIEIAQATGVPAHVSHFHAQAPIVLGQLDRMAAAGIDATFDAYPYIRGCSLLGMPLLPPEISILPVDEAVRRITDSAVRSRLRRDWFPKVAHYPSLGADWPSMITLAHIAAPEYAWAHGLTLAQAALRAGVDVPDLVLDILAASRLEVNMVMAVRYERPARELAQIFTHPSQMGGSDGIFIGAHPHPRARGTFARYLREYVSELHTWSWSDAVHHLSALPARRFGLGHRGQVVTGAIADLIVVDPERVRDRATYADPVRDAVGIGDVVVAGVQVLAEGELTGATPGRGLRREGACDQRCSTMAPPAEGCPPSATPRPH
jgi:N-acyl-D-amino-acid deacylase